MNVRSLRLALATAALMLYALLHTALVAAQAGTTETAVTIMPLAPFALGEHGAVQARLADALGQPVAGEPVELLLDGVPNRRTRTDAGGMAAFSIARDLTAGSYPITIQYPGSKTLAASSASGAFTVALAPLTLSTVPPLAGVRFVFDGREYQTGADGAVQLQVDRPALYHVAVLPYESPDGTRRAEFQRWEDEIFETERVVRIPTRSKLTVGLIMSYRVRQSFVDLNDRPVDPALINDVVFKSSHGQTHTVSPREPLWLQANRVTRRQKGLEEVKVLYSIERISIEGTNAVHQSQQQFYVESEAVWRVRLLLYEARFTAHDAIFGYAIGSGVELRYPNGRLEQLPFDAHGEVNIAVPRGEYQVRVNSPGIAPFRAIALSRDQEVPLEVISYLDLAVGIGLLAALALGLLFKGRPHLFALPLRRPVPVKYAAQNKEGAKL